MRFGSVCSGIEAASVAWDCLGWSAAWFAEIDAFPSAVLAHHFPDVMNVGDMTTLSYLISSGLVEAPDILVGGTPCQAFSVAGSRQSLDDDRGQLTLEYCKIADAIDEVKDEPCIAVWENVPGVLNTKDNAFGCFLGELSGAGQELQPSGARWTNAGCVFGPKRAVAWRILDAQYFGVAQRRRRVFVVASARKGFDPSQILFEFEGVRRDSAPSRTSREETARETRNCFASSSFAQYRHITGDGATLKASGGDLGGGSENIVVDGFRLVSFGEYADDQTASTMKQRDWKDATDLVVGTLDTQCGYENQTFQSVMAGHVVVHGTQDPLTNEDLAFPLGRNSGQENAVFFASPSALDDTKIGTLTKSYGSGGADLETKPLLLEEGVYCLQGNIIDRDTKQNGSGVKIDCAHTLTTQDRHAVACGRVRRLIPVECERLQGFPDNWTKIPYRNKPAEECPDGPRYAACGNSMAVPVMQWIGFRIDKYVSKK